MYSYFHHIMTSGAISHRIDSTINRPITTFYTWNLFLSISLLLGHLMSPLGESKLIFLKWNIYHIIKQCLSFLLMYLSFPLDYRERFYAACNIVLFLPTKFWRNNYRHGVHMKYWNFCRFSMKLGRGQLIVMSLAIHQNKGQNRYILLITCIFLLHYQVRSYFATV